MRQLGDLTNGLGVGHWAAGRRHRALAAWACAAGFGLVAWGLSTEGLAPA
jgi:hypothetical protein